VFLISRLKHRRGQRRRRNHRAAQASFVDVLLFMFACRSPLPYQSHSPVFWSRFTSDGVHPCHVLSLVIACHPR